MAKKRRPLLTTREAAEYLGLTESRIMTMVKTGEISYYRGEDLRVRGHRYDPMVLDAWMRAQVIRAENILAIDAERKRKKKHG